MTLDDVIELIRRIKGDYPRSGVSEDQAVRWFEKLESYDTLRVNRAYDQWWTNEKAAPSFSDLYGRLGGEKTKRVFVEVARVQRPDMVIVRRGELSQWFAKKDAIYDRAARCWKAKIDFCLDYLGFERVNQMLRERLGFRTTRDVTQSVKKNSFPVSEYQSTLAEMVVAAKMEAGQ